MKPIPILTALALAALAGITVAADTAQPPAGRTLQATPAQTTPSLATPAPVALVPREPAPPGAVDKLFDGLDDCRDHDHHVLACRVRVA